MHPDLVLRLLPYVLLATLVGAVGVATPATMTSHQLQLTVTQAAVLGIVALGQTMVFLSGGIDLSVAGVLSLSNSLIAAYSVEYGGYVALAGTVCVCALVGAFNGLIIHRFQLQPFIVTLGTWFIAAGLALYVLPVAGGEVAGSIADLTAGDVFGVDKSVVILLGVLTISLLVVRSRTGVDIRAFGSNPTHSYLAGVDCGRVVVLTYAFSGLMAGVAGVVLSLQTLGGDPTVGPKYLLPSVAAAVVGGTSLFGGSATMVGTVVGALVLSYVGKATYAAELPSEWSLVFSGLLLAFAVGIQGTLRSYGERALL